MGINKPPTEPVPGEAELVRSLMPQARRAAVTFAKRHPCDFEEAYSDALLGLLHAVRSHDPARSPLGPWAELKMKRAMLDGLRVRDHLARRHRREGGGPAAPLSLDFALPGGGREVLARDVLASPEPPPGSALEEEEEAMRLLAPLGPSKRELLWRWLVEGKPQTEAAAAFNVGYSRASYLCAEALRALRVRLTGRASL